MREHSGIRYTKDILGIGRRCRCCSCRAGRDRHSGRGSFGSCDRTNSGVRDSGHGREDDALRWTADHSGRAAGDSHLLSGVDNRGRVILSGS